MHTLLNQIEKKKRNQGPNRNKSDMLDAIAIAKNLVIEFDNLPFAKPGDLYLAIQQILNTRNNYNVMSTNLQVSLHNLLIHNYMNYKSLFKDFNSKMSRAFFYHYPSPHLLNGVTKTELHLFLKKYHPSVRVTTVEKIMAALGELELTKQNEFQKEQNKAIRSNIKKLESLKSEMAKMEEILDELIEQSGYPLKSIPGVGTVLAATFIANIGDNNRFKKADSIAKLSGVAPYTYSSGKTEKKCSDYLNNRELNNAFYAMALTQIRKEVNPIMHEYYEKKQKEGRNKKQAMVFVARRLVNIVFRIMKDKKEYVQPEERQLTA